MDKQEILIVDDESANLSVLIDLFKPDFRIRTCKSGEEALSLMKTCAKPDLMLLDIVMPGMDGFETLARMYDYPRLSDIPVIFISALDSDINEDKGLSLGAVDYITKPFKPSIVMARVSTQLELKQARDLLRNQNRWLEAEISRRISENLIIQDAIMISLTQLAETRDDDTGTHILRTCLYIETLAKRLQKDAKFASLLTDDTIARIIKAAPLHDIGKIGIPDAILLKKGPLDAEERRIIETHSTIGANTLKNTIEKVYGLSRGHDLSESNEAMMFLREAKIIAEFHHEKWDGTGYPHGLSGEDIPLSARLMALSDVFDALTTPRPYKNAWDFDKASEYIIDQKNAQFSPEAVEAFENELNAFRNICTSITEEEQDGG